MIPVELVAAHDRRWELYKILGDPARLRLLAAAALEELSIGELAELFDESQSNVSRQLSALRKLGVLAERKQGTRVFVHLDDSARVDPVIIDALRAGELLCEGDALGPRIAELVARRDSDARAYFAQLDAPDQAPVGFAPELPAYLAALAPLLPRRRLAVDVGTGAGPLLDVLAPVFSQVIGVDREQARLTHAAERVAARGYDNVELIAGAFDCAEVRDRVRAAAGADVVFASRILHHAPKPREAMAGLAELLAPDGCLVVIDYRLHHDERFREEQADLWLGFSQAELMRYAVSAGLTDPRVHPIPASFCGDGPDGRLGWQMLTARRPKAPVQTMKRSQMETMNG